MKRVEQESFSETSLFVHFHEYRLWKYILVSLLEYGVKDTSKLKVLDAGCGSGLISRKFLDYGFSPENVYGVDVDEWRIELAKKNSPSAMNFNVASINNLEFDDGFFDIVLCAGVLIVINKLGGEQAIRQVSKELHRVIKGDGLFLSAEMDLSFGTPNEMVKYFDYKNNELIRIFSPEFKEMHAVGLNLGAYNNLSNVQDFPAVELALDKELIPSTRILSAFRAVK